MTEPTPISVGQFLGAKLDAISHTLKGVGGAVLLLVLVEALKMIVAGLSCG